MFIQIGNISGLAVGSRVFIDDHLTLYSFMLLFVLSIYFICAFFTIFIRTMDGQFAEGVKCFCASGTILAVNIKKYKQQILYEL